jgi:hypothetical protein
MASAGFHAFVSTRKKAWMPTFVGMTDGVNRSVCINAGWY